MNDPVLEIKRMTKQFPGVLALNQVDFKVYAGEVHALVGENGAGKSTLLKILGGIFPADSGEIMLEGKPVIFNAPAESLSAGISIIFQELDLAPDLTIWESLFLGREKRNKYGFLDIAAMRRETRDVLKKISLTVSPDALVRELPLAVRQMVEIAKALARENRIILMDEPTAALNEQETKTLFERIRQLKSKGKAIVYISHRLKEIFQLADRVSVLRDGRLLETRRLSDWSETEIIRQMVGREMSVFFERQSGRTGATALVVDGLSRPGDFDNISFQLRAGEILGIAGLEGCGRREVLRAVFGLLDYAGGTVRLHGNLLAKNNPAAAIAAGMVFLSEDRKEEGILSIRSLSENTTLMMLKKLGGRFLSFLNPNKERRIFEDYRRELKIRAGGPQQKIQQLSGGNQQKVLMARLLAAQAKVLLLNEPTRGIDVGTKEEMYHLFHTLAARGLGILLVSSDLPELLALSDRLVVMHNGRLAGELADETMMEESVMQLATGMTR